MTPSLSIALPSIHRITKRENKVISKPQTTQPQTACQFTNKTRHHVRTTSVPSVLPSFKIQKDTSKLSMDILLDAIDLDQQMRQFFRTEVVKSKTRISTFKPSQVMMARRRSKSAPGAPPSYHHQRAFSARWTTPNQTVTSDSQAQEVAKLIVQQHFEAVKKR
ncbi:uncharacterized protein EV154DRAFT_499326 [Mucor mucedo]|uniref:Uncharacterized protein n=1 Tax=Mucor saturninus TaxID=64648 RepID=A0A8H7R3H0_9FUNG|nr:uncharacterized protein EV154DRAFT_499326 [Mucor mucedo]KAG2203779.1 hypothetical protein INT47_012712 [Mucor saturninus]KAI7894087.1 hypothetical protein EV154DRAFT_499326 [Mucor mucedo]